jgi:hypothetical protein
VPVAVLGVLATSGCAADSVPTDLDTEPECGNGVVESGEQCDLESPGCLHCGLVPGWSCTSTACVTTCGDGVVGTGSSCADAHRDTDCDLTGYWAVRETDYTRDTVVGALQTSSTWQLYHFEQMGESFQVVEQIECGVHVTGSVTVDETGGTLRALVYRNRMDGKSPHGARRGTSKAVAGGCAVTFDRWYKSRGVSEEKLLPTDFATRPTLGELPPLPSVDDPTKAITFPPEAEDWDGDHIPGIAFRISGFAHGVRNTVQRDWREFATLLDKPIPARALVFTVPGAVDLQEKVLRATDCGGLCALISTPANPARDVVGRMTLSFIGKTLGSKRVANVVVGPPRLSLDDDLATCARVRLLLPHDTSAPTPLPKP